MGEVRIAFGTDERTELTEAILTDMREGGHRVIVVGDGAPWPDVGRAVEAARGARRWNDANVLALGLRLTSREVAREMIEAFLATGADAEERENVAKLG